MDERKEGGNNIMYPQCHYQCFVKEFILIIIMKLEVIVLDDNLKIIRAFIIFFLSYINVHFFREF